MSTNVLLVVLDSVRARNTSLHGYKNKTTPHLESFAEDATTYTQARAPGAGSLPSHASIFTGLHVEEHRLNNLDCYLERGHTIWEQLADRGYETGVFSYNANLTQAPVGFTEAFHTVEPGDKKRLPFSEAADPDDLTASGQNQLVDFLKLAVRDDATIKSLCNGLATWNKTETIYPSLFEEYGTIQDRDFTDLFLSWLDEQEGPWAACVNYMDAHVPYQPRPEHNKWADQEDLDLMEEIDNAVWEFISGHRPWSQRKDLERLYDGAIRQVDAEVGRLVEALQSRSLLDDTLVVFTADHGEGFGELGELRPARSVAHGTAGGFEEGLLHVPLVVRYPGGNGPDREDAVSSLTEFPNVVRKTVEGTGTAPNKAFVPDDGYVRASTVGLTEAERTTAEKWVDDVSVYEPGGKVVYETTVDGEIYKCISWNGETTAITCTDPFNAEPVEKMCPPLLTKAFGSLKESSAVRMETSEISSDVKERLEELGYR